MRFPLALTSKIAAYIIGQKLRGTKKFATVLQLEPLHTCNLTCTGCGRIREYSTSLKDMMSLEDCLGAAEECNAPMISICGGEPLIYPHIEALVNGLLEQGRIIYICTNAMFMRKKMREWLATQLSSQPKFVEDKIGELLAGGLISEKDAAEVRKGPKDANKPTIAPSRWMYWNVHLDGLERIHDLIVEREGVFKECILAIKMAKILGYQVATNTTIYKETDMKEVEQMFDYLSDLGVDGHTISPGYEYDAAKKDMIKRLNLKPENFFLTREMTKQKFSKIEKWMNDYTFFGTPIYFEFLAGHRDLTCSAWAIPTRNIRGWKVESIIKTMKTLLAVAIVAVLVSPVYGQSAEGQPAGPKTTGPGAYSPANSPFKKWTTAQLQQRRLDLYRQIPQTQTNLPGHRGEPVFIHHGGEAFSDQQKEIYAIEGELNYRYQHGDKDAELKRAMPGQPHM